MDVAGKSKRVAYPLSSRSRDALASTRDACAPQTVIPASRDRTTVLSQLTTPRAQRK